MSGTASAPLIVITPPPTPNGRLHVGHVAGPYLRADLFTRLVRIVGRRDVYHTSHLDTYQSYVPKKARELNRDVAEFLAETGAGLRSDFTSYGIHHDVFVDNTAPEYLAYLDGAIEYSLPRLTLAPVASRTCATCTAPLFESNLRGRCRYCLHDVFQNVCENCCVPQEPSTMVLPVCATCGDDKYLTASTADELVLTVDVDDIARVTELVGDRYAGNHRLSSMFSRLAPHRVALTYASEYGVHPRGLPSSLNPWIEIYFAHLYAVMHICEVDTAQPFAAAIDELNAVQPAPEIVNFFGVDNSYYYAFLFPLLSERLGIPVMVPAAIKASFFLLLNNAKVSSSRNNVVWAADLLDGNDLATLRTSLAFSCPEFAAKNYSPRGGVSPKSAAGPDAGRRPGVEALDTRLGDLATARAFNVEAVLDLFDKGMSYAGHLRSTGGNAEADAVESWLTRTADELLLG